MDIAFVKNVREKVRNIWGAISSGQIEDKDVEGQAKRLLEYVDDHIKSTIGKDAVTELEQLRNFAYSASKTLSELAGGGSECFSKEVGGIYLADVGYCVERILERRDSLQNQLILASNKHWNAKMELNRRLDPRHSDILVEALSEIKATVDGDSDQPVRDIVYGCLDEIKALHQEEVKNDL